MSTLDQAKELIGLAIIEEGLDQAEKVLDEIIKKSKKRKVSNKKLTDENKKLKVMDLNKILF